MPGCMGGDRVSQARVGLPELQIQGSSQTGQVKQCMQHLHSGAGVHESGEEHHKLGCERRAVPSQELWGIHNGSAGKRMLAGHASSSGLLLCPHCTKTLFRQGHVTHPLLPTL